MRSRRTLLAIVVLSALLLGRAAIASAESRTVIGLKSGAGAGLVGLEIEHRFDNGFAIGATGGALTFPVGDSAKVWLFTGAVSARYYFSCGSVNPFVAIGAGAGSLAYEEGSEGGSATLPLAFATVGAEVMSSRLRIAGEIGYGYLFDNGAEPAGKVGYFVYGIGLGCSF